MKLLLNALFISSAFIALNALLPAQAAAVEQAAPAREAPAPKILYDLNLLPAPVRQMRERILDAAKSGNIENLRPLLKANGSGATSVTQDNSKQDPIAYLKDISADGRGIEILANIVQILQSGYVHLNSGKADDIYVWPYFAALSPDALSDRQMVEAYEIMSVDDLNMIKEVGHYIYFRIGIAPDGSWRFFLTGDDKKAEDKTSASGDDEPALPNRSTMPLPTDSD